MKTPKFLPRFLTFLAAFAFWMACPTPAASQGPTFTAYSGYRLGGSLGTRDGDLKLDSAPFFGGQLDFRVRSDATAAIMVDYQPTFLRLKRFGEPTEALFDLNVWYFQAGGTVEVLGGDGPVPFALGSLGMSWFDPTGSPQNNGSEYGLSGIFGGGVKVPFPSQSMALRLQARILLNSVYGGSSLWCGTGSGCYIGTGGYLGPVQFDFGGGLTFGGR